jgi:hypothetical protein
MMLSLAEELTYDLIKNAALSVSRQERVWDKY